MYILKKKGTKMWKKKTQNYQQIKKIFNMKKRTKVKKFKLY